MTPPAASPHRRARLALLAVSVAVTAPVAAGLLWAVLTGIVRMIGILW